MDGSRFDALARSLAGGTSRRGFLAGLAALAAGLTGASAACPPGRISRRGQCLCKLTGRPPVNGVCPCPASQVDTGDGQGCLQCRAVADCPDNDPCAPATCRAGVCVRTRTPDGQAGACPEREVCCGGACTALGTDANCTACGDVCLAGTERCDAETGCFTCYQVGEALPGGCTIDTVGLCCNGRCGNGVCCSDEGGSCGSDGECCPLSGLMCYAGTCVSCLPTGAPLPGGCNIDTVGLCCNGRCSGSICCSDEGGPCANDGECCALSGLTCQAGTCQT